ncbi:hypothetical protein GQ600_5936 [Phytophthora cactorum]|nr:hypothetical protein GQ600_5936 [Phytophthora cactorum]
MLRHLKVTKTPKELETRLRTLKRTHGNDLSRFPPCFFTDTRSRRPSASEVNPKQPIGLWICTIANVRQRAGALHENAGELLHQALFDGYTIIAYLKRPAIAQEDGDFMWGCKRGWIIGTPAYCYATTVYLNSFLFVDDVNVFVLRELCLLPRARVIISTESSVQDFVLHAGMSSVQSGSFIELLVVKQAGR